jgi:hypothetical protein
MENPPDTRTVDTLVKTKTIPELTKRVEAAAATLKKAKDVETEASRAGERAERDVFQAQEEMNLAKAALLRKIESL